MSSKLSVRRPASRSKLNEMRLGLVRSGNRVVTCRAKVLLNTLFEVPSTAPLATSRYVFVGRVARVVVLLIESRSDRETMIWMVVRSTFTYSTEPVERVIPLESESDSSRVMFSKTMVPISTGSSKVTTITPELRTNIENSVKIGGVVSGVNVLAGIGLIPSNAGWAGFVVPVPPAPKSLAIMEV